MTYPWRVWLAFEHKHQPPDFARGLAGSCRLPSGRINVQEFERWLDLLVEHSALWGQA